MLQKRLSSKNLTIEMTPVGLKLLAKASYDPQYGARPVRRAIQDLVEDPLTQKFLEGEFKEGDAVIISVSKEELTLKKKK